MPDIVDAATRSRMMAGIKATNTRPEMAVRRGLHALGYRYRLHVRRLPGRPDLVFSKFRAVVLVNGCFWHGHCCSLAKTPGSNSEFWAEKIGKNRDRDKRVDAALSEAGWRVLKIWECAMRGPGAIGIDAVVAEAAAWLSGTEQRLEVRSR